MFSLLSWTKDQPWAILEEKLLQIKSVLQTRADDKEKYAELKAKADQAILLRESKASISIGGKELFNREASFQNGILHYPINGTLVPKSGPIDSLSGLQSYESIQKDLKVAVENASVRGVFLCFDSGGGSVLNLAETIDILLELKSKKPLIAYNNSYMCSAAYWLAATSNRIFASKSTINGSIGVVQFFTDYSKANEEAGIKEYVIRGGFYKHKPDPDEGIDKDGESILQSKVDKQYSQFISQISELRSLDINSADIWANGRVFSGAQEALDLKLIDEIATEQQAYEYLQTLIDTGQKPLSTGASTSPTNLKTMPTPEELQAAFDENPTLKASIVEKDQQINTLKATLEAKEKDEKNNLIAQIESIKTLTASEKILYAKASNDELTALLGEFKASEKLPPETGANGGTGIVEPPVEKGIQKVFVGAVVDNQSEEEKLSEEDKKESEALVSKIKQGIRGF